MSLDLEISRDFSAYGYDVNVNAEAFLTLCEVAAHGCPVKLPPAVSMQPGPYFGMNVIERMQAASAMRSRGRQPVSYPVSGDYMPGSNHIYLMLNGKEAEANNTLRHEIKHWAEDIIFDTRTADLARLESINASALAGRGGVALLEHLRYRHLPHERRARRFASDYRVRALVGNVIEYKKRP